MNTKSNKLYRLLSFLSFGTTAKTNKAVYYRIISLNLFSYIGLIFFLIFGTNAFLVGNTILGIYILSAFVLMLINYIYLRIKKKIILASYVTAGILTLLFIYLLISGGKSGTGIMWLFVYPLITLFVLGATVGSIFTVSFLVVSSLLIFIAPEGIMQIEYNITEAIRYISAYITIFILSYIYIFLKHTEYIDLQKNLQRSKKESKVKDEFLSNLSYQIRTPLNNIMVLSKLVAQSELNKNQEDLVNTIQASANNLVNVVDKIVNVSTAEIGTQKVKNVTFDLFATIDNTLKIFGDQTEKDININFTNPEIKKNILIGDPIQLKQILLNIIENIIRGDDSNTINIDFEISSTYETTKSIDLLFVIKNNNPINIPSLELQKQQFIDKTYASHDLSEPEEQELPYIDLTIARRIIESYDSQLNIESNKDYIKFTFILKFKKVQKAKAAVKIEKPVTPHEPPKKKKKIELENSNVLLVEDNLINQKIVVLSLQKIVKNIDIANNGKEALDKFGSSKYDLILMDIQMPVMDGMIATKKIREIEASTTNEYTPIIAITANALSGDKENCLAAGMNDYISKPFQVEVLIEKMKNLLSEN